MKRLKIIVMVKRNCLLRIDTVHRATVPNKQSYTTSHDSTRGKNSWCLHLKRKNFFLLKKVSIIVQ